MSIEYHKVVKQYDGKDNFQIFVFRYDRDEPTQTLALIDLWLYTRHGKYQSKIRIDLDLLAEQVYHNPEQQIPQEQVDELYEAFDNLIDDRVKMQRKLEILEMEVDEEINIETNKLIRASEAALSAHPINQTIDEIVKNLQNETKDNTHNKS